MPRWTPEDRQKQAAKIRDTRPWEKSTGPRTAAGKARIAHNALRHGHRAAAHLAAMCRLRRLLKQQRDFLRLCDAWTAFDRAQPKPRPAHKGAPAKSNGYLSFKDFFGKQTDQIYDRSLPSSLPVFRLKNNSKRVTRGYDAIARKIS